MGRKPRHTRTPRIEQISEKIEHWRKTRLRRTRMPDELWQAAVALAHEHGVYATARDLRLSYDGLKTRLEATPTRGARQRQAPATFVELGPALAIGASGSVVELLGASGAKLTIRLV